MGIVAEVLLGPETVRLTLYDPTGVNVGGPMLPLLHPLRTMEPPVSRPQTTSRERRRVVRSCLRKAKIPAKLVRSRGQPRSVASAALECEENAAGRIAWDEVDVGTAPGATSVQSVTPTVCATGAPGTGAKTSDVGVTVQTELAGRPEQAKVTVPLRVFDGTTMTVASAVEPWAVPALNEPTGARVVGEMKEAVKVAASGWIVRVAAGEVDLL